MQYDEVLTKRADVMNAVAATLEAKAEKYRATAVQCDEAQAEYVASGEVILVPAVSLKEK